MLRRQARTPADGKFTPVHPERPDVRRPTVDS
jgi:hypothetical protein